MSSQSNRLDLLIDVLDLKEQRANVVGDLYPSNLIEATLQEFTDDLSHLGKSASAYRFFKLDDNNELNGDEPLGAQLENNERLVLKEWTPPLPAEAQTVDQALYLSDETTSEVYKLSWFPAIIGRPDASRPENELVAINLETHQYAQRVSRRHVKISHEENQFWVESMSSNATELIRNGETLPVTDEKQVLEMGDIIQLKRSKISLKVEASSD